jgi:hypothetical protein
LSFYYRLENRIDCDEISNYQSGYIAGLVDSAEFQTSKICSICGCKDDIVSTRGWIMYLCRDCMEKKYAADKK